MNENPRMTIGQFALDALAAGAGRVSTRDAVAWINDSVSALPPDEREAARDFGLLHGGWRGLLRATFNEKNWCGRTYAVNNGDLWVADAQLTLEDLLANTRLHQKNMIRFRRKMLARIAEIQERFGVDVRDLFAEAGSAD